MEHISEIRRMEDHLNAAAPAVADFSDALEKFAAAQLWIRELNRYYGSEEWFAHLAADDAGELPQNLRRGVLSEDALYDLIADNRAAAIRMLEIATEILKQY